MKMSLLYKKAPNFNLKSTSGKNIELSKLKTISQKQNIL